MNFENHRVVAAAALEPEPRANTASSIWFTHLICLSVLIALLGAFNERAIAAAVRVWWVSPTFSHCFLVIPVSAYFVWRKRHALATMTPVAYPRALWLLPPIVVLSLVGQLTQINEIEQLALVALVQVLILAVLGLQIYRTILFPALFLFFLVPMGEYLILPLQQFTTTFISAGLTLLGIPHYTEGYVIELSNGNYEVAEACAGLRFLIATIAIGVLFVHLTYRKWHKIVLYLAASVILPVIANGMRALGIVLVAHWSNNSIAEGTDHIVYGWGFLVAILVALMFIGTRYADPIEVDEAKPASPALKVRPRAFAITALVSLTSICFVPTLLYAQSERHKHFDAAAFSVPPAMQGWQIEPVAKGWSPNFAPPAARLVFAMRKPDAPHIDVFVNYYIAGVGDRDLVSSTNRLWSEDAWHPVSQASKEAAVGERTVHLHEDVIAAANTKRMIWWAYWSGGRFTTRKLDVKLDRLRGALSGRDSSALVAVSSVVDGDHEQTRARLRQALAALGEIAARLQQADRS